MIVAGVLEFDTLHRLGMAAQFGVAIIEESAKLLVPVGVLVLGRWRRPADGLIIGVASGIPTRHRHPERCSLRRHRDPRRQRCLVQVAHHQG